MVAMYCTNLIPDLDMCPVVVSATVCTVKKPNIFRFSYCKLYKLLAFKSSSVVGSLSSLSATEEMNSLNVRFKQVIILRDNALRVQEHSTLSRLMYTCRNAHRRTPYFLRLEHVRRLNRRIDAHPAWHVIVPPSRKKNRVSLSPSDLRKLDDLTNLVDTLVHRAVPIAAEHFTSQLIARKHFIPLATTVVAILARILALERPLLRNLQGALTEAKILVPAPSIAQPSTSNKSNNSIPLDISGTLDEDIGEVVSLHDNDLSLNKNLPIKKKKKKTARSNRSKRFFSAVMDETEKKASR